MKLAAALLPDHPTAFEWAIFCATGSNLIHTVLIEDDGQAIECLIDKLCHRRIISDLDDPKRWLVIDLPWQDNPQAKAWRDSTIGAPYNIVGCCFAALGHGLSVEGEYYCAEHSCDGIGRLTDGPIFASYPLPSPVLLVREVQLRLRSLSLVEFGPRNRRPLMEFLAARLK